MAFSLKSLLKGKKKDPADAMGELDDDPFARASEEIPAMEAERLERAKNKRKTPPLARMLEKMTAALPFLRKGKKDSGPVVDPFDNPELMALIASEVAAIPLPEEVASEEPQPAAPKAKPAPEPVVVAPPPPPEEPEEEEPDLEDELSPQPPKPEREYGSLPNFAMPDPMKNSIRYEGDEDGFGGPSLGGVDDDDRAAGTMSADRKEKMKKVAMIAAAGLAGVAVVGGGLWMVLGGEKSPATSTAASGTVGGTIGGGAQGQGTPAADDGASASRMASGKGLSGDKISMALPPPPAMPDASAEAATEKSASRRPWLTGGDAAAPETPPAVPAAATPEPSAQPPAQAAVTPPPAATPVAPQTPDPASAAASGGNMQVALAPLPKMPEVKQPNQPNGKDPVPSYEALPRPAQPAAALTPAPAKDLVRQSPLGMLPVRAADGRAAWQAYARPFTTRTNTPRVALVVVGLGMNPEATSAAITSLPADVTLAFSPYAPRLSEQMAAARAAGHEVLLDLPMEPDTFPAQDPGPLAMLSSLPASDNITRLETALGRGNGYTGVISRMGSKFTAVPQSLRPVLEALSSRGLLYVSSTPSDALAANVDLPLPMAEALIAIDDRPFRDAIDSRLQYLTDVAKSRGTVVAVLHTYPLSFHRVVNWANGLSAKGISLAPVSAAVSGSQG